MILRAIVNFARLLMTPEWWAPLVNATTNAPALIVAVFTVFVVFKCVLGLENWITDDALVFWVSSFTYFLMSQCVAFVSEICMANVGFIWGTICVAVHVAMEMLFVHEGLVTQSTVVRFLFLRRRGMDCAFMSAESLSAVKSVRTHFANNFAVFMNTLYMLPQIKFWGETFATPIGFALEFTMLVYRKYVSWHVPMRIWYVITFSAIKQLFLRWSAGWRWYECFMGCHGWFRGIDIDAIIDGVYFVGIGIDITASAFSVIPTRPNALTAVWDFSIMNMVNWDVYGDVSVV